MAEAQEGPREVGELPWPGDTLGSVMVGHGGVGDTNFLPFQGDNGPDDPIRYEAFARPSRAYFTAWPGDEPWETEELNGGHLFAQRFGVPVGGDFDPEATGLTFRPGGRDGQPPEATPVIVLEDEVYA